MYVRKHRVVTGSEKKLGPARSDHLDSQPHVYVLIEVTFPGSTHAGTVSRVPGRVVDLSGIRTDDSELSK